ncbi:MAG: hypothetical protein E6J85_15580 [Deltaproteobacteria bacterium]|nr:MAG: hypothetical protein E6J85_15580 [Deltaproteobacteria bacterium]
MLPLEVVERIRDARRVVDAAFVQELLRTERRRQVDAMLVFGMTVDVPVQEDNGLSVGAQTKFVCRQLWRGSVRGSAAKGDRLATVQRPSAPMVQPLLSTGEDEHSWLSMNRTAGTPLLMNEVWSLPRPGRSSRRTGRMLNPSTNGTPKVAMKRISPRAGEVLSVVPSGAREPRSRGVPAE